MGLDMYLTKRTYVKNWNHMSDAEKHEITIKKGGEIRTDIKPERICEIIEDVGYWRKANQIHKWFVDNVQDGEDDCRTYYVPGEKLLELKDVCLRVLEFLEDKPKDKVVKVETGWANGEKTYADVPTYSDTSLADELLPTQGGFFFGGTLYDEWYLRDLQETVDMINALQDEDGILHGHFEYHASW